jgi:hypothetical protein
MGLTFVEFRPRAMGLDGIELELESVSVVLGKLKAT